MKKWIKRSLLTVALVLVAILGFATWSWHLLRGTPDWYNAPQRTDEERAAAANRVDQKLLDAVSWASEAQAQATSNTTRPAAAHAKNLKIVSFTEDELNAFFQKWNRAKNWGALYEQYLTDPVIVIHDGRIVLAGKMKELGTVASVHFEPAIDDEGKLHLDIAKMLGGRLPLPTAVFGKYRTRITDALRWRLPAWQQQAGIDARGANEWAVSAALSKMFLEILNDKPAEATIFLPTTASGLYPVQIRDVKVEDDTLTLSVEPLNAAERTELLVRLREPYGTETALTQ
jgi:hypothetical protein